MMGEQIKTMLEAEMKASEEFTTRNFGLAMGDDFREIVEEVVKSGKVAALLTLGLMMAALTGEKFGAWARANGDSGTTGKDLMSRAILENYETFKVPMQFLYWGIQVGRKLAQQETEALKNLEA